MKSKVISAVVVLLAAVSVCQADMAVPLVVQSASVSSPSGADERSALPPFSKTATAVDACDSLPAELGGSTLYAAVGAQPDRSPQACVVPPGPDSATLFLSALASLGAWHMGRSAKKLSFGHLPDWYHTGGPAQIGHTFVFDLDFNSLLPCGSETLTDEHRASYRWRDEAPLCSPIQFQSMLTSTPSCGPPSA